MKKLVIIITFYFIFTIRILCATQKSYTEEEKTHHLQPVPQFNNAWNKLFYFKKHTKSIRDPPGQAPQKGKNQPEVDIIPTEKELNFKLEAVYSIDKIRHYRLKLLPSDIDVNLTEDDIIDENVYRILFKYKNKKYEVQK